MKLKLYILLFSLTAAFSISCSEIDPPSGHDTEETIPKDKFLGDACSIKMENTFATFPDTDGHLFIKTPDNTIISRKFKRHNLSSDGSMKLEYGLKDGLYELLYMEYDLPEEKVMDGITKGHFGLTCRIEIKNGIATLLDKWNPKLGLYGSGTPIDTIRIASADQMVQLTLRLSESSFEDGWENYYFLQCANLDGKEMSMLCSREYGWIPLGYLNTTPFRSTFDGGGYKITGLKINKELTAGVGLFGYAHGAHFRNIHLDKANLNGDFAVGGILGAAISSEGKMFTTIFENCKITNSTINTVANGFGAGGILGCVDQFTRVNLSKCSTDSSTTVYATMNAGGMIGVAAIYSNITVGLCENHSDVTSDYGCAGGIVGACDTLYAAICHNAGTINGAVKYKEGDEVNGFTGIGAGGIAGGTGMSCFGACTNKGTITGYKSAGGILGSTRVSGTIEGEDYLCQNSFIECCTNKGTIKANDIAGGICGEAQISVSGCINEGDVIASNSCAGGIVAVSNMSVVHNNINTANVTSQKYAGGIASVILMGNCTINHNYGYIRGISSHAGGILGYGGRDISLIYCGNFGTVYSSSTQALGGLAGECGDMLDDPLIPDWAKYTISVVEIVLSAATSIAGAGIGFAKTMSNGAKLAYSIPATLVSLIPFAYDVTSWGFNIDDEIRLNELMDMADEVQEKMDAEMAAIQTTLKAYRKSFTPPSNGFSSNILAYDYPNNVQNFVDYYEASDDNAIAVNDSIQQYRLDEIDKALDYEENQLMKFNISSGVAVLLSTVAVVSSVVSMAMTAGATAPTVIASCAGFAGAIIGGATSISQTALATEYNCVIIEECLNAAKVESDESKGNVGGIVGILHDHGKISDCLNTGSGPGGGGHLVGKAYSVTTVKNSLSIAPVSSWGDVVSYDGHDNSTSGVYYCTDNNTNSPSVIATGTSFTGLTYDQIADPKSFVGWDIGTGNECWTISPHSEHPFPILNVSKFVNR